MKPLLAEKVDLQTLQYPVLASPKYDGFRCLIDGLGMPLSRNMKPIPNLFVQGKLKELNLPKFDGELLTYTNGKVDEFSIVQSKLSSREGLPDFKYMVFDFWGQPDDPYVDRYEFFDVWITSNNPKRLEVTPQKFIAAQEQLLEYEAECLAEGWEGVMVRDGHAHYKFGRSTTKEAILLKLKRFFDDEAVIVSAHELMHNANEATINALGHTERSSHKENMVPMGMLGKFTVEWKGLQFDIGTGFTESMRHQYWAQDMAGKTITFKYQSTGPNGKPRFPVFLGIRHDAG